LLILSAALVSLAGCHSDKKKDVQAAIKKEPVQTPDAKAKDGQKAVQEVAAKPASKAPASIMLAKEFAPVEVDFERPLDQFVEACRFGSRVIYKLSNGTMMGDCPREGEENARGKKALTYGLFKTIFGKDPAEYGDIVAQMDQAGYRPATTPREILGFALNFPDAQKECIIFALGGNRFHKENNEDKYLVLSYGQVDSKSHDMVRALAYHYVSYLNGKEIFHRNIQMKGFLGVKK